MSDSNRANLAYVKETTFGEVPAGPPTLQDINFVSEALRQDTNTVLSQTIRSDRQIPDIIRNDISALGDINFEMQYGGYDDWIASALMGNAWTSETVVIASSVNVSVTASSGTFALDTGTWTNTPTAGQWVEIRGFTGTSTNNGYFKVVSATTTTIVVENKDNLVDESAGDSIDIDIGGQVTNGTTLDSYVIEREYLDLSNTFAYFTGMVINTWSLEMQIEQIITGTFGWLGKQEQSASATQGDGSNTAASANDFMNNVDHIQAVLSGVNNQDALQFGFNLNNNNRIRKVLGTLGAQSMGSGSIDLSGSLRTYFEDATEYDRYLNFTETSLAIQLEDSDGNAYIFDFPAVKFTSGQRVAGGINQDIVADLQWAAKRESTEDVTMRVVRFPA